MFKSFKLTQIVRILSNRGAISREEYFAFVMFNKIQNIPRNKWDFIISNQPSFRVDYVERAKTKMLYQPGFLQQIEFDYNNNLIPYLKKSRLFSIL